MKTTKSILSFFSLLFFTILLLGLSYSCNSSDGPIDEPIIDEPKEPEPDPDPPAPEPWPYPKAISLWNHLVNLDISNTVDNLGINLIWAHDSPYSGQSWEDSHMYKSLQVPGIDYVFGKINRVAWGWTHRESVEHAKWVATL